MAIPHAEVNDFVRKDRSFVRVIAVDIAEQIYRTSDGGYIGFKEVGRKVFLESEVYDKLKGNIPDAVHVEDEPDDQTETTILLGPTREGMGAGPISPALADAILTNKHLKRWK